MKAARKRGKLVVRYGPMGSKKTSWLIDRFLPGKTMIFLPALDHRSGAVLKAHSGKQQAKQVYVIKQDQPEQILNKIKGVNNLSRIVIDETNFFAAKLVKVIEQIRNLGIEVFAAGLLLDSERRDFGPTKALVKQATEKKALYAKCDYINRRGSRCELPAKFNYFKGKKRGQVVVGAFDLYGTTCAKHYPYFRKVYQA